MCLDQKSFRGKVFNKFVVLILNWITIQDGSDAESYRKIDKATRHKENLMNKKKTKVENKAGCIASLKW